MTEREKAILRLKSEGLSDYKIARKLHSYPNSIRRSRKNALRKIESAKRDVGFASALDVNLVN